MNKPSTPFELQRRGMEALVRELGYADALRFMLQFSAGKGDYTKERRRLLAGATVEELLDASAKRIADHARAKRERRKRA